MCGIAGLFHPGTPKPVEPQRVRAMIDALAHRGPDGEGVWTAPGVGLGHRRLSIIDLEGSPQPMRNGVLTVTYNGEIYNFQEVRAELEKLGARFATDSDTDTVPLPEMPTATENRVEEMLEMSVASTSTSTPAVTVEATIEASTELVVVLAA